MERTRVRVRIGFLVAALSGAGCAHEYGCDEERRVDADDDTLGPTPRDIAAGLPASQRLVVPEDAASDPGDDDADLALHAHAPYTLRFLGTDPDGAVLRTAYGVELCDETPELRLPSVLRIRSDDGALDATAAGWIRLREGVVGYEAEGPLRGRVPDEIRAAVTAERRARACPGGLELALVMGLAGEIGRDATLSFGIETVSDCAQVGSAAGSVALVAR